MLGPPLVIGTRNRKKCEEIVDLLAIPGLVVRTLDAFPDAPTVVEDGATFLANATKKAVTLSRAIGHWVLGEDSGLVVDALGGAPGIHSARFAGEPCDDERNNDKLLAALDGLDALERTARYVCAMVVADPTGFVRAGSQGTCEGSIATQRRGTHGFGYDPLFQIGPEGRTFGERPPEYKRHHSHRAAALRRLHPQLIKLIRSKDWCP